MTKRLNGWQRIGIVLSLFWLVFVCGYTGYEFVEKVNSTTYLIEVTHNKPTFDSQGHRIMTIEEAYGDDAKRNLKVIHFLSVIFIPITLAWAIGYLYIFIYRWIMVVFKSGQPHSEQIQIPKPSPVNTPLQQTQANMPTSRAPERLSAMKRAWNGEESLWRVFWLYNILGVLLLGLIEKFCHAFLIAAERDNQSYIGMTIFYDVVAILFFPYIVWALASLWRCAFNTGWKGWGYLGRAYVVWWGVGFIAIVVSIILHK
jgi:hypothetical protein